MKARVLTVQLIAILTLILFAATSGQGQDIASAKSFVEQVYAGYSTPDWQHQAARQAKFYTRSLKRMIVADAKRHPGEISNLDFDPICACQDPGDPGQLKVETIKLIAVAKTKMKATVTFRIAAEQRTVSLSFLRTASGWSVDDISSKNMHSLRELLTRPDSP